MKTVIRKTQYLYQLIFSAAGICFLALELNAATLDANADLTQSGSTFTFTLYNHEPPSSPNFLDSFNLLTHGTFTDITAPDGWSFDTDFSTFINWYDVDDTKMIAPGSSAIFSFIGTENYLEPYSYSVTSWDTVNNGNGPSVEGTTSTVPDPASTFLLLGSALVALRTCFRTVAGDVRASCSTGAPGSASPGGAAYP